jgi:hypothetical protein
VQVLDLAEYPAEHSSAWQYADATSRALRLAANRSLRFVEFLFDGNAFMPNAYGMTVSTLATSAPRLFWRTGAFGLIVM